MSDVFDILSTIKAPQVLDAATGKGEFINILRQRLGYFVRIVGVDSDAKTVEEVQNLFPGDEVEIYQMNLERLSFKDNAFDLVSISNALHHLANLDLVLDEMMRALKPGGHFLISEMYQDGSQSEAQRNHIMLHHWVAKMEQRFGIDHFETYDRQQIIDKIRALALTDLQVMDYFIPVENPKDAKNCENLKRKFEGFLKCIDSLEDSQALMVEGERIQQRIQEHGCAPASRVLILGTKSL
ncbi:MAG TPA: class I SAM-dependent methyltransferase [Candidatus Cloacimonadota bacterium]|nr:class I SAM-dependent methyltransferase [Candidatus Cloacimonadota bacterium]